MYYSNTSRMERLRITERSPSTKQFYIAQNKHSYEKLDAAAMNNLDTYVQRKRRCGSLDIDRHHYHTSSLPAVVCIITYHHRKSINQKDEYGSIILIIKGNAIGRESGLQN